MTTFSNSQWKQVDASNTQQQLKGKESSSTESKHGKGTKRGPPGHVEPSPALKKHKTTDSDDEKADYDKDHQNDQEHAKKEVDKKKAQNENHLNEDQKEEAKHDEKAGNDKKPKVESKVKKANHEENQDSDDVKKDQPQKQNHDDNDEKNKQKGGRISTAVTYLKSHAAQCVKVMNKLRGIDVIALMIIVCFFAFMIAVHVAIFRALSRFRIYAIMIAIMCIIAVIILCAIYYKYSVNMQSQQSAISGDHEENKTNKAEKHKNDNIQVDDGNDDGKPPQKLSDKPQGQGDGDQINLKQKQKKEENKDKENVGWSIMRIKEIYNKKDSLIQIIQNKMKVLRSKVGIIDTGFQMMAEYSKKSAVSMRYVVIMLAMCFAALLALAAIYYTLSSITYQQRNYKWGTNKKNPSESYITFFGRELYDLYDKEIKPIEEATHFNDFILPSLTESHFTNPKPIISLVGQYSSGKSSFVNLLLNSTYPEQFTSIAASTSEFMFINNIDSTLNQECINNQDLDDVAECSDNMKKKRMPCPDNSDGKYFVMNSRTPFNIYQDFSGTEVIDHMKAAFVDSDFLKDTYIIDTPGISAETPDSCNFIKFYNTIHFQSDLIIFMFDPYKPSDLENVRTIFSLLKHFVNKVRFVINKADSLRYRELLDVYGAIQYNLGRSAIFGSLEINRFYLTSLWDAECLSDDHDICATIEGDKQELFAQIKGLNNERFGIESKIKSLSERIEIIKKYIDNVEQYTVENCDCGWISCACNQNTAGSTERIQICFEEKMDDFVQKAISKQDHAEIERLQDLNKLYQPHLSQAHQKLTSIAEKLEDL